MFNKVISRQQFNRCVDKYDAAAVLQAEIAKRLGQRLDYIKLKPQTTLDMGCGTGFMTKDLLKRYPKSTVYALDSALKMAQKCKKQGGCVFNKVRSACADAENLPFKADSVDLMVSNLMLNWTLDLAQTLTGFQGVIAPNGLLLFSMFGPDTLTELRQSWQGVDDYPHTQDFADMHEVGDALLQAGFINPVTDMELITMTYKNVRQLLLDIKNSGASNCHAERFKGLMGKQKFSAFEDAYEQFKTADGLYPASFEIIYGHAWVGEGVKYQNYDNVIPIHPAP